MYLFGHDEGIVDWEQTCEIKGMSVLWHGKKEGHVCCSRVSPLFNSTQVRNWS